MYNDYLLPYKNIKYNISPIKQSKKNINTGNFTRTQCPRLGTLYLRMTHTGK